MPYGLRGFGDTPLGIVAVMPPLPPSACGPTQHYINPGGRFSSGPMAGQITPTGACEDGPGTAQPGEVTNVPVCSGLYSLDAVSNTCTLQLTSTPVLLAGAAFALALVFVGGR